MGSRNLTLVIKNDEIKIAQYGNDRDQELIALNFLKKYDLSKFLDKLEKCRFIDKEKDKEIDEYLKSIGSDDGWLTMDQSRQYNKQYKYLSNAHGVSILNLIDDSDDEEIWLDYSEYNETGTFSCEYCYIINFDKNTFEVKRNHDDLIKIYELQNLPSNEDFIKDFEI